jgi:signal transduction histidine kinase
MNPTILYVDDDDANLTVFELALAAEFEVRTARSGAEALAVLRGEEVAVVLADQRMPGMTGVELIEQVRAEFPDTIRMLITAYSDLEAAVDSINRGRVHRYLRKPWDVRELRATLSDGLERYAMAVKLRDLERRLVDVERVYSLGVIAAGLAHEIRGPLAAVTINLELARDTLKGLDAAGADDRAKRLRELDEGLADAESAAGTILEITRGIELPSRSAADDAAVDLEEVVRLALRGVRGQLMKQARLEAEVNRVPTIRGNRTKLGQVVLNLLVNALQALPEGRRSENRVAVRLGEADGHVRLEVEDNGAGIPAAIRTRIFDPFFTTKKKGGTGLGLAISRTIVEESGGRIEIDGEEGRGTRFTVILPIERKAD